METQLSKWPIYRPFWSPERLCTYKSLDVYIIMYFAMKGIIPLGILNILLHYSLSYHSLHCGCFGPPVCTHNSKMASLGSPSGKPLSTDDEPIWNFAVLWTRENKCHIQRKPKSQAAVRLFSTTFTLTSQISATVVTQFVWRHFLWTSNNYIPFWGCKITQFQSVAWIQQNVLNSHTHIPGNKNTLGVYLHIHKCAHF